MVDFTPSRFEVKGSTFLDDDADDSLGSGSSGLSSSDNKRVGLIVVWILLVVGLLVWFRTALKNRNAARMDPRMAAVAAAADSSERKRSKLLSYFATEQTEMLVGEDNMIPILQKEEEPRQVDDIVVRHDNDNVVDPELAEGTTNDVVQHRLSLPCRRPEEESERVVTSTCSICFEEYQAGDYVVWSSSQECPHVFHRSCLVEYLCKVKNQDTPCPCCRQTFCNLPPDDEEEEQGVESESQSELHFVKLVIGIVLILVMVFWFLFTKDKASWCRARFSSSRADPRRVADAEESKEDEESMNQELEQESNEEAEPAAVS